MGEKRKVPCPIVTPIKVAVLIATDEDDPGLHSRDAAMRLRSEVIESRKRKVREQRKDAEFDKLLSEGTARDGVFATLRTKISPTRRKQRARTQLLKQPSLTSSKSVGGTTL